MITKKDLRGIVTIVMLVIFFLAIFVPLMMVAWLGIDLDIPETYTQAIISLTTIVVTFYFSNKATRDKMEGEYYYTRKGYQGYTSEDVKVDETIE